MKALEFAVEHGVALALGATLLLAAGAAAALLSRAPFERRRYGVVTAFALLLYLVAALVPMPRWQLPQLEQQSQPAIAIATDMAALVGPPPRTSAPVMPPPSTVLVREPASSAAVRPLQLLPPATSLPLGPMLAAAFLCGGVAMALWLLCGYLRLRRLLRHSRPAPAWLCSDVAVPVRVTARGTRPFCSGALWPVVVLPHDLAVPARANAARAVLAHELAHVRAGDCRAQLLFALLLPLLYWQPLFWWLRAKVRFCSELLADDRAAQQLSVRGYASELLEVVATGHARVAHAGALSVFHRPSEFYQRMQMLLRREVPLSHAVSRRHRLASAASVLTMVAVTAGFCGVSRAQEPQNAETLRAEAAQLRQMVRELKVEVGKLQQQLDAKATARQLPADTSPFAAAPQHADLFAEAPDAAADPAGVPILKDIPILGEMFRSQSITYVVKSGDTLEQIAQRHGGGATAEDLVQVNPGLDPRRLRTGQKIVLPVRSADSAPTLDGRQVIRYTERSADPIAVPQPSERDPTATNRGAPVASHAESHSVADRSLSDVLNVVTRCIELRGNAEIAEAEYTRLQQLGEQNLVDRQSVQVAAIKLRTLKQQHEVAEKLLKGELASAKAELQRLEELQKAGLLPAGDGRIAPVANFVQVLLGPF